MHREFDPAVEPLARRSAAGVFAFTAILVVLLILDILPLLGVETSREIFGRRYALIAAVLGGARVLFTALDSAFDGRIGADLAVAIACLAAILIGEPLVAAEVVVIGLIGECLEAATFDRTQRALRSLAELFPTRTWVLRDGVETRIFTSQLAVGDTVIVKPGGKIPVDGVVLEGASTVDVSALTGESLPQDKTINDAVLAGSVNQFGALSIRADKVAKQTVAGRVIELTAQALKEKAPLERYADKLARRFLPIVLALAALAFAFNVLLVMGPWAEVKTTFSAACRVAIYPTLAVLVVACPCPLVLATPAAVIAALGRLAGTGVLLKGGAPLERLAAVTYIAFDKTGTLTTGDLELGDVVPINCSREELLQTAATAEQKSEHPLARLILKHNSQPLAALDTFESHAGGGVSATAGGEAYLVGTRRLLEANHIEVPDSVLKPSPPLRGRGLGEREGEDMRPIDAASTPSPPAPLPRSGGEGSNQTTLFVAKNGVLLGHIGARDTLRTEAAGVIEDLKALGLTVSLLTGDRAAVAHDIAARVGIEEVHADLLPAEKAELLQSAIRNPQSAFLGDGINDAPALATASVGIAVGSGTEIAAHTGDVVMLGEPLRPLPFLIRLSREAVAIIRQNILIFGFGVNIAGVVISGFLWPLFAPNAAWFESAPLFAVIFHQIGSFAVLVNSMRLLAFEKPSRVRSFTRGVDRWLNTIHFDDAFHYFAHRWKRIAIGAAAIAFLAWLGSGLTQVNANEVGIVQRFGAVKADLAPGLHLRYAWPIESTVKLKPAVVRTVEVGFRMLPEDLAARSQLAKAEQDKLRNTDSTWASGHTLEMQRLTDESLYLTGDGSLIEILATVRYAISDPRVFYFNSVNADSLIRTSSESVLRELAAGAKFEDLLTADRTAFEAKAFARLKTRLDSSLGVKLEGLTLHDLHPPQEVVAAYHAVAEAIQKRDRTINEANADATRVRRRAADEALYLVRNAEAEAAKKVSEASAARDTFLAWHAARTTLSPAEEEALAKVPTDERAARRKQMLAARRALTELRLMLDSAVSVLAGRDKILIDSENVPGRRTLFLADPEAFKLPAIAKPEP